MKKGEGDEDMVDRRVCVDCLVCFLPPLARELCGAGVCCEAPPCLCGSAVGRRWGGCGKGVEEVGDRALVLIVGGGNKRGCLGLLRGGLLGGSGE